MPNVKTSEMPSSYVRDSFPPTEQPLESYQVSFANILVLTGITDDAKEHRQVYRKQNGGWLWHRWLVERRRNRWWWESTQENSSMGSEVAGDGAIENSVLGKDADRRNTRGRLQLIILFFITFKSAYADENRLVDFKELLGQQLKHKPHRLDRINQRRETSVWNSPMRNPAPVLDRSSKLFPSLFSTSDFRTLNLDQSCMPFDKPTAL